MNSRLVRFIHDRLDSLVLPHANAVISSLDRVNSRPEAQVAMLVYAVTRLAYTYGVSRTTFDKAIEDAWAYNDKHEKDRSN